MTAKLGIAVISFAHGHANLYCRRIADYADRAIGGLLGR